MLAVVLVGILQSGCEMNFPKFELTAPMVVTRVNLFPAEAICVISDQERITEIISKLGTDYRNGWKRNYVSLAPTYKITGGTNEVLLLKRGIAIVVRNLNEDGKTYSHEYEEGAAEEIVRVICKFEKAK
jgi:hypothetical protein